MRKWIKNAPKTIDQTATNQQLYFIYKLIANRQAFNFTFKGIVKNLLTNLKLNCQRICGCCTKKTLAKKQRSRDPWQTYFENGKQKLTKDLDIERLLRTLNGFEALRSVILNKEDRFFLEYQKKRVIQTDSDLSKASSSSDDYVTGHLAPYGQNDDRNHFLIKLKKYLKEYEGHHLKESQRRILLGVKTANANLLDKAIHERKLKKEKEEYKKTV